ncbi:M28 family peptidase [Aeromicrobium sp.]|uniref:M28 family peptidase n=1 Tax=Aeromicrobium sp. TaxID=1871063 RepID=UPI003D6BF6D1
MRRAIAATAAVILTGALIATAPAQARNQSAAGPDDVDTTSLTNAVKVKGIMAHQQQFQKIANANDGTRASGTPGYDASADYVARKLREAGYDVTRQTFTFPFFRELSPTTLTQLTPTQQELETAIFTYSGSGDVSGSVVPTNDLVIPATPAPSSTSGCQASDFDAAPAEPSIALIQRGSCTFEAKVDNAKAAGYDAAIIFNEGNPGRTDLAIGTLGVPKDIPVVGLSYADAVALNEDIVAGGATAHVTTDVEVDLERETENVIADLPSNSKTTNPDQTVVVGAHLDSVVEGAGINDNGSGSSTILETAEQMSELRLNKNLERPVRFAFWGAEESGLLGSEHYVANLSEAELADIYANLNYDMLGSPNYVRFVYDGDGSDTSPAGPPGSGEIEKIFTDHFDSKGLASDPTEFSGRSDYGPFIAVGIPAGGLFSGAEGVKTAEQAATYGGTAGAAYDPCYHQACDDITNLNSDALHELGDAAAHATGVMTMSKAGLFTDGSRTPQRTTAKQGSGEAHGHPAR